jgi:hypothetical protein
LLHTSTHASLAEDTPHQLVCCQVQAWLPLHFN